MPPVRTYHRRESLTQTPEIARLQEESLEIWGTVPNNYLQSNIPKVKAYEGSLPAGARGIEFTTDIEPDLVRRLVKLAGVTIQIIHARELELRKER